MDRGKYNSQGQGKTEEMQTGSKSFISLDVGKLKKRSRIWSLVNWKNQKYVIL